MTVTLLCAPAGRANPMAPPTSAAIRVFFRVMVISAPFLAGDDAPALNISAGIFSGSRYHLI
jgi:hypothetical protein